MGHQQILLIVLGVIVVGIAMVMGNTLFRSNSEQLNKDFVIQECKNLAVIAQEYFKKTDSMGGGGNSFNGWTIPFELDSTINGVYYMPTNKLVKGRIVIIGKPLSNSGYKWNVIATISNSNITLLIIE